MPLAQKLLIILTTSCVSTYCVGKERLSPDMPVLE